jgi:hypothetical protein
MSIYQTRNRAHRGTLPAIFFHKTNQQQLRSQMYQIYIYIYILKKHTRSIIDPICTVAAEDMLLDETSNIKSQEKLGMQLCQN